MKSLPKKPRKPPTFDVAFTVTLTGHLKALDAKDGDAAIRWVERDAMMSDLENYIEGMVVEAELE